MRTLLASCLLAAFFVAGANAQTPPEAVCGPFDGLLRSIAKNYGEVPAWTGEVNGQEFVLLQSISGSWSLLRRNGGMACVVAGGTDGTGHFIGRGA
ncbi:hypothetical protein [Nitratireductor indicus]|uniref:hypothetical protein n=1 Tax=Nitratireductor indicus TaxID=721133 RepID=UPI0028769652|nr:hypothetical protein [Nitratireductor indicus]MDS1138569.1 hypothetical protein [Nitratireductor indicus]